LVDHDPAIATKYIMAVHPARAYYAGARYLSIPTFYDGPLDGIVSYEGLPERVKTYAPKYPTTTPDSDLKADYLIYDTSCKGSLPQFSFLLDEESTQIPANFKRLYKSSDVAVYEIERR
jgi:hypothetical protein